MGVALDCVSGEAISSRAAEILDLGKRAGERQQTMIREVLQAFSADLGARGGAELPRQFARPSGGCSPGRGVIVSAIRRKKCACSGNPTRRACRMLRYRRGVTSPTRLCEPPRKRSSLLAYGLPRFFGI
jgi:hypothetical protein